MYVRFMIYVVSYNYGYVHACRDSGLAKPGHAKTRKAQEAWKDYVA